MTLNDSTFAAMCMYTFDASLEIGEIQEKSNHGVRSTMNFEWIHESTPKLYITLYGVSYEIVTDCISRLEPLQLYSICNQTRNITRFNPATPCA